MAKTSKTPAVPVITAKTFTVTFTADEVLYTDKAGRTFTGATCATLLAEEFKKAIGYAASREATLERDRVRKATGVPAGRVYVNGNLPAEAGEIAAQFRAAVAALVPSMAPKAPPVPKAPPIPKLDLTDDLPAAVAQVMAEAPAPVTVKAPKASAKALSAVALAAPATVIPPGVTKASARKAAKAAPAIQAPAPVALPAKPVEAPKAPPVPSTVAPVASMPTHDEMVAWFKANSTAKVIDYKASPRPSGNKILAAIKAARS